jgi:hypothetical protein
MKPYCFVREDGVWVGVRNKIRSRFPKGMTERKAKAAAGGVYTQDRYE